MKKYFILVATLLQFPQLFSQNYKINWENNQTISLTNGNTVNVPFFSNKDNTTTSTILSAPVSVVPPTASSTTSQPVSGSQQPAQTSSSASAQQPAAPGNVEATASAARPASQPPHDLPEVSVPVTQPMSTSQQ